MRVYAYACGRLMRNLSTNCTASSWRAYGGRVRDGEGPGAKAEQRAGRRAPPRARTCLTTVRRGARRRSRSATETKREKFRARRSMPASSLCDIGPDPPAPAARPTLREAMKTKKATLSSGPKSGIGQYQTIKPVRSFCVAANEPSRTLFCRFAVASSHGQGRV